MKKLRKCVWGVWCTVFTMCIILSLGCMKVQAQSQTSGTCGENVTWTFDAETGELALSGSGAMADFSYSERPWQAYIEVIKRVVISDGVTNIGTYAFSDCAELQNVTIPESVTSIGEYAFAYCSLPEVVLPGSITEIGEEAFSGCEKLSSIKLSEGLLSIGGSAFRECFALEKIEIPKSVTNIGSGAFSYCMKLTEVVLPEGITSIANGLFYSCSALRSIEIPENVTSINGVAFFGCSSLKSVTIPNGVTEIQYSAFNSCKRLTNITIPESVVNIDERAFEYCTSLEDIVIPDGVTNIYESTFFGCTGLMNVSIPDTVTSIGVDAFRNCNRLINITIPQSIKSIGETAFEECNNLTVVTIKSRDIAQAVTSADGSGKLISNAKTVYLKSDIDNDIDLSFYGLTSVKEVNMNGETYIEYSDHVHMDSNSDGKCDVCVPAGLPFTDVAVNDYFANAVFWAADTGVTSGLTETTFAPMDPCTRAQVVTFLWRANESPDPGIIKESFSDVQKGAYCYDAVHWAANNGITLGYGNGKFGTDDNVTRAQFVTLLWRAKGEPIVSVENTFSDISENAYYYDAVLWAAQNGITTGYSAGIFAPDDICSRGQVVTFLFRTGAWMVDGLEFGVK